MRFTLIAAFVWASVAFAQPKLNLSGTNGNVLHPGIPMSGPPPSHGPGHSPGTFGRMSGGRLGGRYPASGAVFIPFPVYGGYGFDGFYSGDYAGGYSALPGNYDPAYRSYEAGAPYGGPAPTIIINQNFQPDTVHPQLRDYSNVPLPAPGTVMTAPAAPPPATANSVPASPPLADDQPTIFLIAMRDHSIYPVIAYWVQGDALNYVTEQGVMHHVDLALVDRDLSRRLNAERNVPFNLPAAR